MSENKFSISVEYDGGLDVDLDQRIMSAVGYELESDGPVKNCDAGFLLIEPYTRDQVFYFEDEAAAFVAEQALRRIGGIRVARKP